MKTRTTTLIVTLLAAFAITGIAQQPSPPAGGKGPKPPGMSPAQRMEEMKTKLGLTDDQAAKLKAIFESNAPARKAIKEDQALTPEQKRAKFKELQKQTEPQIAAILTVEQKLKWEELKKEGKAKMEAWKDKQKDNAAPASSPTTN